MSYPILDFMKFIDPPHQYLPIDELYMPPLNIRLLDHRTFGLKPLVGTHTILSLKDYRRDPVAQYQAIRDKMLIEGLFFVSFLVQ
jgi:hypothetical protein